MKNNFLKHSFVFFCWLLITNVSAQNNKNCGTNCFQTNILSLESDDQGCVWYEFEITYSGDCESDLSHYTVSVPQCATINSVSNSENWKQELNITDPSSGFSGFKIDDIPNFGNSNSQSSFTVSFTLCTSESSCSSDLSCWAPTVAYKAGQCVFYDSLVVQCNILEATLIKQNLTCFESGDGTITVEILDGVEPYQFEWSHGATTQQVGALSVGSYSVIITDAKNQQLTLETTLEQPNEIIVIASITDASCSGISNGAIDVTVSGGQEPYSFLWSNGSTSEDLESLMAGSYSVQVLDSTGCPVFISFQVNSTSVITIESDITNTSCTAAIGAISITVDGGTEPYSYEWSNSKTTQDIDGLEEGNYTVIVTDALGCQTTQTFRIRAINTLTLAAQVTKTGCVEDDSGAIDITVSGGTQPYSFEWSNGETTEDLSGLTAGDYKVVVTDASGCTRSLQLAVFSERLFISVSINKPSCFGEADGSISVVPLSGEEPYTYLWSNSETGSEIIDLTSGFYSLTITDATGCSSTYNYFLNSPSEIIGSYSISNNNCNAEGNYNIDLEVSGGTQPYTYNWSNGKNTEDLDSLNSGEYSVFVIDANDCTWEQVITIEGNPIDLSCLIEAPDTAISCNTDGNTLNATVIEADHYSWSISSNDGSWIITSGENSSQVVYSSGNEGSMATLTLTVEKEGCMKSCSIDLEGCSNDGGDDDGDNNDDSGCGDSYSSEITLLSIENDCYLYEAIVSYNGDHSHGLSHYTIDIPCGNVTDVSNSGGWKDVVGSKDPTSGLWGLKIDDINEFGDGSEPESFHVKFMICNVDNDCQRIMDNWNAIVAYKAGQCVAFDTIGVVNQEQTRLSNTTAYPNPFNDNLNLVLDINSDTYASLEILNYQGELVKEVYAGNLNEGQTYKFEIDSGTWPAGFYFYKLTSGEKITVERILLSK